MKKQKKKVSKQLMLLVVTIVFLVGILTIYSYFKYREETLYIDVYYLNTNKFGIEPVAKGYRSNLTNTEVLEVVFNIFSDSEQSTKSNLVTVVPEDLELLSYTLDSQGFLTVSFSPEYRDMTNIEEINFKAGFVWTFTDLDFIKKIKFEIDGYPYTKANSQVIEAFDRTNVIVEPTIALDKVMQRDIVLYFGKNNNAKTYLTRELRTAVAHEGVSVEETIVNELIKGSTEGNDVLIPTDVRVRQVNRENAICFIDLDEKFLKGKLTEREQRLRVYSLVNSLAELSYIDKVQILINAKKTKGFDDIDISKPLKRNEYYIE